MHAMVGRGDGGAVSEHEFGNLVRHVVHSHRVDPEEISLLYRIFDSNRDGFLEQGMALSNAVAQLLACMAFRLSCSC